METNVAALSFLAFAYWFWSPWSVSQLELNPTVQQISWAFSIFGFVYGGLLYLPLITQPGWLTIHVIHYSIFYV